MRADVVVVDCDFARDYDCDDGHHDDEDHDHDYCYECGDYDHYDDDCDDDFYYGGCCY